MPTRSHVAAYLISGRERNFVDSNWMFFRVLIDLGLMHCGVAIDPQKRIAYLDRLERFDLGNGWYRDGVDQERRPLHPLRLPLLWADLRRPVGRYGRAARYRERATAFARAHPALVRARRLAPCPSAAA